VHIPAGRVYRHFGHLITSACVEQIHYLCSYSIHRCWRLWYQCRQGNNTLCRPFGCIQKVLWPSDSEQLCPGSIIRSCLVLCPRNASNGFGCELVQNYNNCSCSCKLSLFWYIHAETVNDILSVSHCPTLGLQVKLTQSPPIGYVFIATLNPTPCYIYRRCLFSWITLGCPVVAAVRICNIQYCVILNTTSDSMHCRQVNVISNTVDL